MAKKKTMIEMVQSTRNTWGNINPVTRVHGTPKGYSKKDRREGKRLTNDD